MAETAWTETRRCSCFFLYDRSKVQGEGDLTRAGIYYFYPEDTPLDQQELVCGQLAGVSRCVSEISSSPVRLLRLRKSKYAIRMRDDFLWVLSGSEIPDRSLCEFLDQLINLFSFYNGPVRRSYQLHSQAELALRWARYLSHLQGGTTELYHIFSCLRTIDYTQIDPLLLLKAALILQACQRCPLVLAGCILYRGRVVSTQMRPELTMKIMVHETEMYSQDLGMSASTSQTTPSSSTMTTRVFLTPSELHTLRCLPVNTSSSSQSPAESPPKPRLLSRTLSDLPAADDLDRAHSPPLSSQTQRSSPGSSLSDEACFSPCLSLASTPNHSDSTERDSNESHDRHSLTSGMLLYEGLGGTDEDRERAQNDVTDGYQNDLAHRKDNERERSDGSGEGAEDEGRERTRGMDGVRMDSERDAALEPILLYQHRVRGLVLALLVEQDFSTHPSAQEDVYHSSLASLNGLEAHLRTIPPLTVGPQGPYTFAHYDCIQKTLITNVCNRSAVPQDRQFVKSTALLHSQFALTDSLQEAIIRNAGCAVYATRTTAQETFFLQQGLNSRNSGVPNAQDSAFSLPSKARHRLLKHGVNLL
ncbi:Hermansky-Pudlak syndrome 4 protein [Trichomycterus rosablanca]|uniref:Hermansky-Pudlak syndrome 4 protein n=1 Tax=Trichomycterus rosablanca TaxID=2290929 RepID=UPI002F3504BE